MSPQARPVDPFYEAAAGSANRNLSTTLQQLQYQRGQLGQTYGLGVNAQGGVFDDPTNPYSRAAALQEAYRRSQQGTTTSMAARGQLYAGALQTEQNENARRNDMGRDALIREFLSRNQQLQSGELQAGNAYQDAMTQAASDSILRALAARPDAASVPQPQPVTVKAPAKPKAKPKRKARR
jgi:hypothetical protein